MKPNKQAIETIEQTINHMKQLKKNQFYYGSIVEEFDEEKKCGTVCCVMGWYPKWYPEKFAWTRHWLGGLTIDSTFEFQGFDESICAMHNIGECLYEHLFEPRQQEPSLFGGKELYSDAFLSDVISNWEIVLEKLKSGEIDGFEVLEEEIYDDDEF